MKKSGQLEANIRRMLNAACEPAAPPPEAEERFLAAVARIESSPARKTGLFDPLPRFRAAAATAAVLAIMIGGVSFGLLQHLAAAKQGQLVALSGQIEIEVPGIPGQLLSDASSSTHHIKAGSRILVGDGARARLTYAESQDVDILSDSTVVVQRLKTERRGRTEFDLRLEKGFIVASVKLPGKDSVFAASSPHLTARVAGTRFYLSAAPETKRSVVACETGRVSVLSAVNEEEIMLLPDEMVDLGQGGCPVIKPVVFLDIHAQESLEEIAAVYQVSAAELREINNIDPSVDYVRGARRLVVPRPGGGGPSGMRRTVGARIPFKASGKHEVSSRKPHARREADDRSEPPDHHLRPMGIIPGKDMRRDGPEV